MHFNPVAHCQQVLCESFVLENVNISPMDTTVFLIFNAKKEVALIMGFVLH